MDEQGHAITHQFEERREIFKDKMSPIGRQFYSRRYFRQAVAAWNAGDACTALRYTHLAIHFDVQNADAIALRREIIDSTHVQSPAIKDHLREGLRMRHHPKTDYSTMGVPWERDLKMLPPIDTEVGVDVYNPGQAGPSTTIESPSRMQP